MLYKPDADPRMHPPDLNLAASYIPACTCMGKSLIAFIVFIFSPIRGWIAIASVLCVDRILWNRVNPIIDVNAVCSAMVAGLMVVHTRIDGIHSDLQYVVIAPWLLLSALQMLGATNVSKACEIICAACAVSILSCTYQRADEKEIVSLRCFMFVFANTVLSYVGIMTEEFTDTYVSISRTMLILLGEWHVASVCVVTYLLCMGHQLRSKSAKRAGPLPTAVYEEPACGNNINSTSSSCSEEAGLLREALARKGFTPTSV